ncbi:hypothetical protein ABT160_35450 [Streptomyces sp. NPDC001941]|uniref:hypothetical protein n=1 Tax=Streptomyces sp. NPDC001941 TaxID=3154659 RepID=UPI00332EE16D
MTRGASRNNRLTHVLRQEARWSNADLARAVNALGRTQHLEVRYTRSSVAHWLAGTRPRPPAPGLLLQVLGARLGRPLSAADIGLGEAPTPLTPPCQLVQDTPATVRCLSALLGSDSAPGCRTDSPAGCYTPPSTQTLRLALAGLDSPAPSDHARDRAGIEELHAMVGAFAGFNERFGGGNVRLMLTHYLRGQVAPLLSTRPDEPDLFSAAAQLTHLLADICTDITAHATAQRYYHLAYGLARHARDRHQAAITLRALSAQATLLGHPGDARLLADAALDAAGRTAPKAVQAFLYAQQALAHACDRRPAGALTALHAAERAHDSATGEGPFHHYPRSALDYQRAQVLATLGDRRHAHHAYRSSLARRLPQQHRPLALTHARCAHNLLRTGHLEEACHHWNHFLDHHRHLHSHLAQHELALLAQHLTPHRTQPHAADTLARARQH